MCASDSLLWALGPFNQILEKGKDADLVSAWEGEEEKSPLWFVGDTTVDDDDDILQRPGARERR
jgi:hypothetical protein